MKCYQALPCVSRYQLDGFDLDLTYVTNRVIATSFPSTGLWSLYRLVDYVDNLDLCKMKILFVNSSIKHDLARSCFQLWPKIGDEGDKISRRNWRGFS